MSGVTNNWADAGGRMDRLPIGPFHRRMLTLVGAGMFFDGFDLYLAGSVMGALVASGFSTAALNGWFVTSTIVGMMIGAFTSGWLGDTMGRRFTYQANLAIFGVASLVAAFAPTMQTLIAARFFIGIGLGAEIVTGYATFTEFVPPAVRGRWCGYMAMPVQFALFCSTVFGWVIVPNLGWRPMFVIAGVGGLVIWYLRKNMPESPRWLERKGRGVEADALLRQMEAECGSQGVVEPMRRPMPPASLRTPAILLRLFVGAVTLSCINVVVYGFVIFLPTFFVQSGFSVVRSIGFATFMTLGAPLGALIPLFTADRFGRKKSIIAVALLGAVISVFYAMSDTAMMLAIVGFLLLMMLYANSVLSFAMFVPESFPTDVRLRGTGICNTVGRIVGALTPLVVVPLFQSKGITGVMILMIGAFLVQALVTALWAIEPSGQSLEALEADVAVEPSHAEVA